MYGGSMHTENDEKIKIAILIPVLNVGGSSDVVCRLARLFKNDKRFVVRIFSFFSWGDDKYLEPLNSSDIDLVFLKKTKKLDFQFLRRLKKELGDFEPDVVWTHLTAPAHFVLSGALKILPKCRVFHTIHSSPKKDMPLIYRFFLKEYVKNGKIKLIGVSEFVSLMAAKCYHIKESRITTIPNGIPLNGNCNWSYAKKYDFLCVGRFDPVKNFADLVDAFAMLNPIRTRRTLCLCGYGKEEERIKRKVETLGLERNVLFFGKEVDVSELYKRSKIFCLYSSREGHPITVLEAKSYGLPIIATRVGGIPEMVKNGEDGLLIDLPHDVKAESSAMQSLISNDEMLAKMGDSSFRSSFKFSIEQTFSSYAALFLGEGEK